MTCALSASEGQLDGDIRRNDVEEIVCLNRGKALALDQSIRNDAAVHDGTRENEGGYLLAVVQLPAILIPLPNGVRFIPGQIFGTR